MSKGDLVKVEAAAAGELDALKDKISQYNDGFHNAYTEQMGYAFLAGLAIGRAKEILPHGKFIQWIENEAKLPRMSANRYSRFAEALITAHPAVGKCTSVVQLAEGKGGITDLTQDEQKQVIAAVHDVADGKTLTEFYRDLGVIRQPKKQEYHPKRLTPEESENSANVMAAEQGQYFLGTVRQLLHEWKTYTDTGGELPTIARWPAKMRKEIDGVRIDLGKVLANIKKKSGKAPEPLYACPHCQRDGFMERGLRSHRCPRLKRDGIKPTTLAPAAIERIVKGIVKGGGK